MSLSISVSPYTTLDNVHNEGDEWTTAFVIVQELIALPLVQEVIVRAVKRWKRQPKGSKYALCILRYLAMNPATRPIVEQVYTMFFKENMQALSLPYGANSRHQQAIKDRH
jgi:hypothetical protein